MDVKISDGADGDSSSDGSKSPETPIRGGLSIF